MDLSTQRLMMGAAGSAAPAYVEDVFSTWLYTGNGSTQTITNGIDLSGKGGLVWTKARTTGGSSMYGGTTGSNALYSTDMAFSRLLSSNQTNGLINDTPGGITAVSSTGFTTAYDGAFNEFNASGVNYASWTFRKAAKFFDVVTWSGDGTFGRQISHSLGSAPGCIIAKRTDSTSGWVVYHRSILATEFLELNATSAAQTGSFWGNATATSTYFTTNASPAINASGGTYVAYLFAHDAGGFGDSGNDSVVKCGSASSGTFVDLGWEPQWLLLKSSASADNWYIYDNMRGLPVSGTTPYLLPNTSGSEANGTNNATVTATGFTQNLGVTCIYIAIRRGPMKTPTDATKVFAATTTNAASAPYAVSGFPVDLAIRRYLPGASNQFVDRLRGAVSGGIGYILASDAITAETTGFSGVWNMDFNTGMSTGASTDTVYEMFRRAPGFFDVVAYTGTQSGSGSQVVKHSLGVAPELLIHKQRNSTGSWFVHALFTASNSKQGNLNSTTNFNTSTYATNDVLAAQPTSSQVEFGFPYASTPNTFIAYLFASCPGVSKVGSYTGTGTTLQVNCGFTSGARFVLIKRTDSTGDWYVWDSARGIVAGNDPYLLLNSTAAEVTGTDYVDTFSSGFEISSTAPAAINANGGSFIFLAVS